MSELVVEVHVPLRPAPGEYPFPWIDEVQDFLAGLSVEADGAEEFDDGEEYGPVYIFFLTGRDEAAVLRAASRLVALDSVPSGSFAMVTDDEAAEFGLGRRVELPV